MALTSAEINAAALEVADKRFARGDVDGVLVEDTIDSDGADAIQITIVIRSGAFERIPDEAVLDTLVGIRNILTDRGEARLPIVHYATREELAESADT